ADLTLGRLNLDAAAAGVQAEIATDVSGVDAAAASFTADSSADVIDTNAAAAAGCFDASGKRRGGHAAAFGPYFDQFHVAGNVNGKLSTEAVRTAILPLGDDECGVAFHVSADPVGVELLAGLVF